jgi:hypothetical protein
VQAAGFTAASVNVTLSVGNIANCDVRLKLGPTSETVAVSEQSQSVQAEQTQQASTIGSHQLAELPNLTHLFTDSVFTLPRSFQFRGAALTDARLFGVREHGILDRRQQRSPQPRYH